MSAWGVEVWLTFASVVIAAVALVFTALARRDARRSAEHAEAQYAENAAMARRMTEAIETIAVAASQRMRYGTRGWAPPSPPADPWEPPVPPTQPPAQPPAQPQHLNPSPFERPTQPPPSPVTPALPRVPPAGPMSPATPATPTPSQRREPHTPSEDEEPAQRVVESGPVAWTIEHHVGNEYVLRNLGDVTVDGVTLVQPSGVEVGGRPRGVTLSPFQGHRFTVTGPAGAPLPAEVVVAWLQPTDDMLAVPFPRD